MIKAYIALKREEVERYRLSIHPVEYDMYYSA
jgi:glutamine synthetase